MGNPLKLGVTLLVIAVAVVLTLKIVGILVNLLLPFAIIGGIGLLLYGLFARKSLGGHRSRLP